MRVVVKKIVDWNVALDSALFTINKESKHKAPSDKWKAKACLAEHSMLTDVRFIVEMYDIPCWVAQHISRHDAFASHYIRETKEVHYVGTSRSDRTENHISRHELPQDALVNHRMNLSAKDIITISKLRLCNCASLETRQLWHMVLHELSLIEPVLASKCVRTCVYRGFCPEFDCCGYCKGKQFQKDVEEYRKIE